MPHIYVIHLEQPFHGKQHYCGFTCKDPKERADEHAAGRGARLMDRVTRAGVRWIVARTYRVSSVARAEELERDMKDSGHLERFCPVCSPERFRKKVVDTSTAVC
jgi:predicted GIY-YIG superfamily endonuclease